MNTQMEYRLSHLLYYDTIHKRYEKALRTMDEKEAPIIRNIIDKTEILELSPYEIKEIIEELLNDKDNAFKNENALLSYYKIRHKTMQKQLL